MTLVHRHRPRTPATAAVAPAPWEVDVVRRVGRRLVQVHLPAGETPAVSIRLERHGQLIAAHETAHPVRGRSTLRLPVPRWVLAGPAQVEVTMRDLSGNTRTERVRVHVPAR